MGDGGSYNDCKGAGIDGRARLIRGVDAPLGKHRKRESRRGHLKIAATWSWVDELAAEFIRVRTTPAPT
jgi:hypothetical protein